MKNARNLILIVEDDEKLRQTLEDFLTANHFAVLTAVDGEQALTLYYANNHLIDLGRRPADRARALPHRGSLQETGIRYRLSEGDQGLLHEA